MILFDPFLPPNRHQIRHQILLLTRSGGRFRKWLQFWNFIMTQDPAQKVVLSVKITDTEETEETEKGQRDGWTDKTTRYPVNVTVTERHRHREGDGGRVNQKAWWR